LKRLHRGSEPAPPAAGRQPPAAPFPGPAPASGEAGPARPRWRSWLPWLLAAALLGFLFARLPRAEVERALAAGPWGLLAAWAAAMSALALLADAVATRAAFAATGVPRPFGELLLARGATYLLGLLNSAVGQGGLGFYLLRTGAAAGRAFAAVVFIFVTTLAAMALVTAGGMAAAAAGSGGGDLRPWLAGLGVLAAGFAAYLLALRLRPRWLARRPALAPLFEAGAGGFLASTVARVPHVLSMLLGLWAGLRLWGVPLPLGRGTVLLSVVLLVTALPLAPSGLGTTEAALVVLASPYAPAAGPAARQSLVLAFCVLYHLFGIAAQALLGLLCMGLAARRRARAGRREAGQRDPASSRSNAS
jgi:hypothetical protein